MVLITNDVRVDHALRRAYDSLTQQHVAVVLQATRAVGDAWHVDRHEDYEGRMTILVAARDSDVDAPTFVVSGRLMHIELARIDGEDDLSECGCFSTIEAATAALLEAMSRGSSVIGSDADSGLTKRESHTVELIPFELASLRQLRHSS